jgi:hypothetical protein
MGIGWRENISIWHVIVPADVDRDKYVKNCYNTSTISIVNNNGETLHKVPIGLLTIQLVKFPIDNESLGSPVVVGNIESQNQPVILDVLAWINDYSNNEEKTFRFGKYSNTGEGEITIRGKKGEIYITANGKDEGGKIVLDVKNNNGDAELEINVSGSCNLTTKTLVDIVHEQATLNMQQLNEDKNPDKYKSVFTKTLNGFNIDIYKGEEAYTNIKYEIGVGFTYEDEDENKIIIDKNKFQIESGNNVLNLGNGNEPLILGDTLAQFLNDLITEISKSTTAQGPLLNAAAIAAYTSQVDTIKSEYSNTD